MLNGQRSGRAAVRNTSQVPNAAGCAANVSGLGRAHVRDDSQVARVRDAEEANQSKQSGFQNANPMQDRSRSWSPSGIKRWRSTRTVSQLAKHAFQQAKQATERQPESSVLSISGADTFPTSITAPRCHTCKDSRGQELLCTKVSFLAILPRMVAYGYHPDLPASYSDLQSDEATSSSQMATRYRDRSSTALFSNLQSSNVRTIPQKPINSPCG